MPILLSMLRGVNVGPHNRIKMDELRALYESLKFEDPRTYVQSGNVIFRTKEKSSPKLAKKIQDAIGKKFGCRPEVILRTAEEMRRAIVASPFAKRMDKDIEPSKLLVTFLAAEPSKEALAAIEGLKSHPEEIHLKGREMYVYFPNGIGTSKLPWSQVEKHLKVTGTARNWNSVTKMLEIAEQMEG
ncbi:MAG TPA: DUF1697 domain-containing protein [Candidatus Acidoferrales bacterium]|nr:DUF1697 domain-containing protein [Candidatus Acidoferrales bacterium]